jgi:hypothetical protein
MASILLKIDAPFVLNFVISDEISDETLWRARELRSFGCLPRLARRSS